MENHGAQLAMADSSGATVADLLVEYLHRLGVEYVFGVPGGAIEPFYDALARSARRGGPRPVTARHESGAAFMADGYARATGRLGVCCATTGPGATNMITGVASAYMNHVPLLAVTAQSVLSRFGTGAFQESSCDAINTVGMFQHCTRYNTLVSHPCQAAHKFYTALNVAVRNRVGPVHLSVPFDVFSTPAPAPAFQVDVARLMVPKGTVELLGCEHLCALLGDAEKPLLVMGGGCGHAAPTIVKLAERLGAPVVTTPKGKGAIDPYHPLAHGVVGFAGHEVGRRMLNDPEVDLILVVGASLGEWDVLGEENGPLLGSKVVHVDNVAEHFQRSPLARLHVGGDLEHIFTTLNTRLPVREPKAGGLPPKDCRPCEESTVLEAGRGERINPALLMRHLAERCPKNALFLPDTGNSFVWATHHLHPPGTGRYWVEMGFGAMGWAIGAAVGAAMAQRGRPVVCITGDGSLLMNGQEMSVANEEGLPILFVILNDNSLGMVKHGQRLRKAEPVAYHIPPVDFVALGQAMGIPAHRVADGRDLAELDLERICRSDGPVVLEVMVDPEAVPPMSARAASLGT